MEMQGLILESTLPDGQISASDAVYRLLAAECLGMRLGGLFPEKEAVGGIIRATDGGGKAIDGFLCQLSGIDCE